MNSKTQEEELAQTPILANLPDETAMLGSGGPLVRDSIGYLMSKVVPGFFGLISVPLFVRCIGIEEYGRLSVILPILLALVGAGSGWLQQSQLRFHPAAESETASIFSRAVARGTFYAVLALAFALLPILGILQYPWNVWVVAEVYCAAQLVYLVRLTRLQARLQPRSVLQNEALRACAGFFLPLGLIWITGQRSFTFILLGLALSYAIPLLVNMGSLRGSPSQTRSEIGDRGHDKDASNILKKLWRFGWAVGLWLMLCQSLPIIARSAIHKYEGYAQAGIYASLYEIAVRSFSLFASPVTQAAHPRIMRDWNLGHHAAARTTIRHAIGIQILLFLPVEAAGLLFAGPLTRLALGANNSAPSSLLPWLMLGGFLWQIALLVHKPLEIMRRTKTMLCGMLGVLLIEFAGNYTLIPRFGVKAAVYVFVGGALAYIAFAALFGGLPSLDPDSQDPALELHL